MARKTILTLAVLTLAVLTLAVLTLTAIPSVASPQEILTTSQFGSKRADIAWGVVEDGASTYIGGETNGTLSGQRSAGGSDAFVRKIDADGTVVWTRQFGTDHSDRGFQVTADGTGVYIAGVTDGAFPDQGNAGGSDAFLTKFDADGNLLWTREFGTRRGDLGSNVAADASGVYVVGTTNGTFPGQEKQGGNDVFVRAYDRDGNELWTTQYGTPEDDNGYANAVDATGVSVVGYTLGALGGRNRGGYDAFVSRLDLDGTLRWSKQIGTKGNDFGYGVITDAANAYVSGEVDGALKGQRDHGRSDAFVRAFALADGATRWTTQFGGGKADEGLALATTTSQLYVVGTTAGHLPGQSSSGGADAFVVGLDDTGVVNWSLQFGTGQEDWAYWGAGSGTSLDVVGQTSGTFPDQTNAGAPDAFWARIALA